MKIERTIFTKITIWRSRKEEMQYIAFVDVNKLDVKYLNLARNIAAGEGHELEDYTYFTIAHVIGTRLVVPDRAEDGRNIMMLYKPYFSRIASNSNLVSDKARFIGFLTKSDVRFLVKYVAGPFGRTK